ncbi:MAG: hypothetical protein ABSD82_06030, partial [Solirubrobacteraceae bacterium]
TEAGQASCPAIASPTPASIAVEQVLKLARGQILLVLGASSSGVFSASAHTPKAKGSKAPTGNAYGTVTVSGSGAAAAITIRPSRAATALLARSASLRVSVVVTFTPAGGAAAVSKTVAVTLHGSSKKD